MNRLTLFVGYVFAAGAWAVFLLAGPAFYAYACWLRALVWLRDRYLTRSMW